MSIRKKTTNRLRLIRTCYVCGKTFPTTADSPFMRQLCNVDGKKQKTCYFCSETCKNSTYKHRFDGGYTFRKQQKEQEYQAKRDLAAKQEYNRQYYTANAERERARQRAKYYAMSDQDRDALNWYRRAKHYIDSGGEIRTAKRYQLNRRSYTIAELSEQYGINKFTLKKRIERLGWSVEDAVSIQPKCGGWNGRRKHYSDLQSADCETGPGINKEVLNCSNA